MKYSWLLGLILILALTACVSGMPANQEVPTISSSPDSSTPEFSPDPADYTPDHDPVQTIELVSPIATKEETPCLDKVGLIQLFSIPVSGTQDDISGRIYTPPCYGTYLDQNYPTLYLLHGATESDQQWEDLGVDELVDTLISRDDFPPLIIIMPREDSWIPLPENLFGDHLVNDLIPWVDAHYRTLVDREYRAIGGLSRGGNWAVRIGIMNWDLFEAIGAHSAPLFYGDLDRIPGWIEAIPESKIPRLYLDIGGDDTDWEDAAAFESLLVELSVPHSWHQFPGMHEESYWHAHLDEYLLWYS
ncbi:MAG: hypothetical protein KAU23_00310 [Anaerolineales bacterium]|nr:hypothetical protein [Anaerolineales bacterium]